MTQEINADVLNLDDNQKPTLPTALNVLTILTFIGCVVFGIFTLLLHMIYKFFISFMDKAANSGKEFTVKELEDMQKGRAAIEIQQHNIVPLMIIGMAGIILCFIGALWMRNLKKDGYWMYVAGEVAPLIGGLLILGTSQYNGIGSVIIGLLIPLLFIGLYSMQLKYLIK